ncbi:hypothetical protein ASZ90_015260 [hydrocarbon metagenome]|uniref:Uncharacterized protein n=1 Tax=hydrocarbon metagenome TaxID=938273 RepID=A0A0W8F2J7_9ZZZZ
MRGTRAPVVLQKEAYDMDSEPALVVLSATLTIYPALHVIYEKIGKDDVMCTDLARLKEEHSRFHYGETAHEPRDCSDHRGDHGTRGAIAGYWQRMQKRDAYILENLI